MPDKRMYFPNGKDIPRAVWYEGAAWYVKEAGVVKPATAPGIKLAARKKIYTTTDPMDLLRKKKKIDILIDVTGDVKLKKGIKDLFAKSKNSKTIIMHELIARLFISVSTRKSSLTPSFHPRDIGIGK